MLEELVGVKATAQTGGIGIATPSGYVEGCYSSWLSSACPSNKLIPIPSLDEVPLVVSYYPWYLITLGGILLAHLESRPALGANSQSKPLNPIDGVR